MTSEGGVGGDALVCVEGVPIVGVEGKIEVASYEDAGPGVLGGMPFDGIEGRNGVMGVEVGTEVDVDYEELLIGRGEQ